MAERRSRRVRRWVVWALAVYGVLRWVVPKLLGSQRGRDAVRRFNRRWLNPVMLRMAGRPNWYAARLEHLGRHSGRTYATPVVAKPVTGGMRCRCRTAGTWIGCATWRRQAVPGCRSTGSGIGSRTRGSCPSRRSRRSSPCSTGAHRAVG